MIYEENVTVSFYCGRNDDNDDNDDDQRFGCVDVEDGFTCELDEGGIRRRSFLDCAPCVIDGKRRGGQQQDFFNYTRSCSSLSRRL